MDEIGRGTSTFDGLSLAFACAEYLAREVKAFTLFATHYFELTALADEISTVKNIHFDATEQNDKIIFLHAVKQGPANQSYGIQVAQLAGVPRPVIQLAKKKLHMLENQGHAVVNRLPVQADLFSQPLAIHPLIKKVEEMNPDQLSPREALQMLYQLKGLLT
jgi:DNA mismatch repair protein MutS